MDKIVVFYGSNREFTKLLPETYRNFTDVVMELDQDSKNMTVIVKGIPDNGDKKEESEEKKLIVDNFVISSDEYCGVREHVIINFANFLAKMEIKNMFIQNPPKNIIEQLYRIYGDSNIVEEIIQDYKGISKEVIQKIFNGYGMRILGQEKAKMEILKAIYPLTDKKQKKPVVILFYGDSGLGKTETAQYLSELLNGKLFRKQFSMYQNNEFATYLFGGNHNEGSFAKDLLDRDSNVILLDEFDKANPVFHSAFYQLFDEGVYEDKNYKVNLDNAIVICTSNYESREEIKEKLGNAIYNRFDAMIHFEDLSDEAKKAIAKKVYEAVSKDYCDEIGEVDGEIERRLEEASVTCDNAREIQRLIKDTITLLAVRKICDDRDINCT